MNNVAKQALPNLPGALRTSALASSILVVPFMVLEAVTRSAFQEPFPFVLFAFMWINALLLVLVLVPLVGTLRTSSGPTGLSARWTRVALLLLLAAILASTLGGVVLDQVPCFVGAPNCD